MYVCILLEKFDFQRITDNFKMGLEKIDITNNRANESLAAVNKQKVLVTDILKGCTPLSEKGNQDYLKEELKAVNEDLKSYKKSYELLMESVNEKEAMINCMMNAKENYTKQLQKKDEIIHKLDGN